jgi:hypothetical protein
MIGRKVNRMTQERTNGRTKGSRTNGHRNGHRNGTSVPSVDEDDTFTLDIGTESYATFGMAVAMAHLLACEAMGEDVAIHRGYSIVAVRLVGGKVVVVRPELVGTYRNHDTLADLPARVRC